MRGNIASLKEGSKRVLNDLVAVRFTGTYPKDGVVLTGASETKGTDSYYPRHTTHWALNKTNAGYVGKYAIIAPLRSLLETGDNHLVNLANSDTFFLGDVELPKDAQIVEAQNGSPIHELAEAILRSMSNQPYASEESKERLRSLGKDLGCEVARQHQTTFYSQLETDTWPLYKPEDFESRWYMAIRSRERAKKQSDEWNKAIFGNSVGATRHALTRYLETDFDGNPAINEMYEDVEEAIEILDKMIDQKRQRLMETVPTSSPPKLSEDFGGLF